MMFNSGVKAVTRFSTTQSLLRFAAPSQRLFMTSLRRTQMNQALAFSQVGLRRFSDAVVTQQEDEG